MSQESVVLLHGINTTSRALRGMARFIASSGYKVFNLNYPSTRWTIEESAGLLREPIATITKESKQVHFVGYSMGGLLFRKLLHWEKPENLGRVVMIGTPNHGSEAADFYFESSLWGNRFRRTFGPAGRELRAQHLTWNRCRTAISA